MLIGDDDKSLYAYNRWANERVLSACGELPFESYTKVVGGGFSSVRDALVHIASATRAWVERFHGHSPAKLLSGADVPNFAEAAEMLRSADDAIERLVAETSPEARTGILTYTNLRGETKKVYVWAVFRHVVNHASYHRGQISSMIRALGFEPKPTDLVFWGILNTPQE